MIPVSLEKEVEDLRKESWIADLSETGGMICILLHDYLLPPGYNRQTSDLLLRLPISFPSGKPDMFWMEVNVVLSNGKVPKSADSIETHLGRDWRRFSWHLSSWDPVSCNLRTFLEFINNRLAKGV